MTWASLGSRSDCRERSHRFVSVARPWELAKAEQHGGGAVTRPLAAVLGTLLTACRLIAHELHPLLPHAAARIERALEQGDPELGRTLFPKVELSA